MRSCIGVDCYPFHLTVIIALLHRPGHCSGTEKGEKKKALHFGRMIELNVYKEIFSKATNVELVISSQKNVKGLALVTDDFEVKREEK